MARSALAEHLVRARELRTRVLHLLDRALGVPGLHVDAPDRVLDDRHLESLAQCVEDGVLHAVVGRETGDIDVVHPALAQDLGEVASVEGGIALRIAILGLVDDHVDLRLV
jgi:hypothetical protein